MSFFLKNSIFIFLCTTCLSFPICGQDLLKNGGFDELYPCKTCDANESLRQYELLGKEWECFTQASSQAISFFPDIYIWKDAEQKYKDVLCYAPDAQKFYKNVKDCPELEVTRSPTGEINTISLPETFNLVQKMQKTVKKGTLCKFKAVFLYLASCQKTSPAREIAFFLAKKKPKNTLGNKARLAEIKTCNIRLIGTFNLDSLAPMVWYEKEFTFTAEDDFDYFIGGGLKLNFYDTEPKRPKCLDKETSKCWTFSILYDRFALKKISISDEAKKTALSPDSLYLSDDFDVRGRFARLKGVIFDQNAHFPKNVADLDKIAIFLLKYPSLKIRIEGHADSDGDKKTNQMIAEKRADTVKKHLIDKGVKTENIETKGFGSSAPISAVKAENRRIEIVFLE